MRVIKLIWYYSFWIVVRTALSIYYREIKLSGAENLPKDAPIIFGANHENALIDPLIMTTRFPLMIHYLVRADIFKKPIVKAFLNSLNLMPVYRMSDGVNSVKANEKVFYDCFEIFAKGEHLILFPEATHDDRRIIKRAKKGISRISIGAMNHVNAPKELYIVPTGMNYSRHRYFRSSVHIVFGKPIKVEKQELTNENIDKLKELYEEGLRETCVSLPRKNFEVYDKIFFHDQHPAKILDPVDINTKAHAVEEHITEEQKEEVLKQYKSLQKAGVQFPFEPIANYWLSAIAAFLLSPLALLGVVIHAPALIIGTLVMSSFKDKVWKDTIFFAVCLVLIPWCWVATYLVIFSLIGGMTGIGAIVLVSALICLIAMKVVRRRWSLFITNYRVFGKPKLKAQYEKYTELVRQFRA